MRSTSSGPYVPFQLRASRIMTQSEYHVECECGTRISVSSGQAGSKLQCECGEVVLVPGLEELHRIVGTASATNSVQQCERLDHSSPGSQDPWCLRYPVSSFLALILAAAVTVTLWMGLATLASWSSAGVGILAWLVYVIIVVALFSIMCLFRTGMLTSMMIAFVAWSHIGAIGFGVLSGGVYEGPEQYPIVLFVWCTVWPLALLHGALFGSRVGRIL